MVERKRRPTPGLIWLGFTSPQGSNAAVRSSPTSGSFLRLTACTYSNGVLYRHVPVKGHIIHNNVQLNMSHQRVCQVEKAYTVGHGRGIFCV